MPALDLEGDLVTLLRALVDLESVSGNEGAIADTVQESLCFLDPELDARHREFARQQASKNGAGR